jgi:hypothetical protein
MASQSVLDVTQGSCAPPATVDLGFVLTKEPVTKENARIAT